MVVMVMVVGGDNIWCHAPCSNAYEKLVLTDICVGYCYCNTCTCTCMVGILHMDDISKRGRSLRGRLKVYIITISLSPGPFPHFQCCTLKSG